MMNSSRVLIHTYLNVLVQVVLFFTNKTILWKQHVYCFARNVKSHGAKCTACLVIQTVVGGGGHVAHRPPRKDESTGPTKIIIHKI